MLYKLIREKQCCTFTYRLFKGDITISIHTTKQILNENFKRLSINLLGNTSKTNVKNIVKSTKYY